MKTNDMDGKPKLMNLSIESNGRPNGTVIKDENGAIVNNVVSIKWSIRADGLSQAEVQFVNIPVKIENVKTESRYINGQKNLRKNGNEKWENNNDIADSDENTSVVITKNTRSDYVEIETKGSNKVVISKWDLTRVIKAINESWAEFKYEQSE